MRLGHLIASGLVLSACRGGATATHSSDAHAGPATMPTLTGANVERGPIDALRTEAQRRLRGNWVVSGADYVGSLEAWSVSDGRVRVHDALRDEEWTEELSVPSPCQLERTRSDEDATVVTTDTFVFADDGLHVSSPDVPGGVRQGGLLVVCGRGHVYTYDVPTDRCDVWDGSMTTASANPLDECRVVHGVGVESFTLQPFGGGSAIRLDITGNALLSADPAAAVAAPAASWDEAVREAEAMTRVAH